MFDISGFVFLYVYVQDDPKFEFMCFLVLVHVLWRKVGTKMEFGKKCGDKNGIYVLLKL